MNFKAIKLERLDAQNKKHTEILLLNQEQRTSLNKPIELDHVSKDEHSFFNSIKF